MFIIFLIGHRKTVFRNVYNSTIKNIIHRYTLKLTGNNFIFGVFSLKVNTFGILLNKKKTLTC